MEKQEQTTPSKDIQAKNNESAENKVEQIENQKSNKNDEHVVESTSKLVEGFTNKILRQVVDAFEENKDDPDKLLQTMFFLNKCDLENFDHQKMENSSEDQENKSKEDSQEMPQSDRISEDIIPENQHRAMSNQEIHHEVDNEVLTNNKDQESISKQSPQKEVTEQQLKQDIQKDCEVLKLIDDELKMTKSALFFKKIKKEVQEEENNQENDNSNQEGEEEDLRPQQDQSENNINKNSEHIKISDILRKNAQNQQQGNQKLFEEKVMSTDQQIEKKDQQKQEQAESKEQSKGDNDETKHEPVLNEKGNMTQLKVQITKLSVQEIPQNPSNSPIKPEEKVDNSLQKPQELSAQQKQQQDDEKLRSKFDQVNIKSGEDDRDATPIKEDIVIAQPNQVSDIGVSDQKGQDQKQFPKFTKEDQSPIKEQTVTEGAVQNKLDQRANNLDQIQHNIEIIQAKEKNDTQQTNKEIQLANDKKLAEHPVNKRQISEHMYTDNCDVSTNLGFIDVSTSQGISMDFKFNKQISLQDKFPTTTQNKNIQQQQQLHQQQLYFKTTKLLKSGYLMKKSQSIIYGFQKRYFELTPDKLLYFKDNKKQKMRGCINFGLVDCMINVIDDLQFEIIVTGYDTKFILKALSKTDEKQWINIVQQVIDDNQESKKVKFKTGKINQYLNENNISEEQFIEMAETGDIVLFETNNFGAKMQRKFTNSKYDHVGMCIKFDADDLRIFDAQQGQGVGINDWKQFIEVNDLYTNMAYRKLIYDRKEEIQPTIFEMIGETIGKKYQLSVAKLLKKKSLPMNQFEQQCSKKNQQKQDSSEEGYFCSQLVAKIYKRCKLLPQVKSSCQYWPVTFTDESKMQLMGGAKLSPAMVVVLKKHRKIDDESSKK